MRSSLHAAFVISLACFACGPISDWPNGSEEDDGPGGLAPGTFDGGAVSPGTQDAGVGSHDAGAGGGPGGGYLDANTPTHEQDAGASSGCSPDAGDAALVGDAQLPDGTIEPFAADAGDAAWFRPFPPAPDAQAPVDAAQPDAESDAAHVATAPGLPCW